MSTLFLIYGICAGLYWVVLNVNAWRRGDRDKAYIVSSVLSALAWPVGLFKAVVEKMGGT